MPRCRTASGVIGVTSNTITYTWNANGNPSPGTLYQINISTDAAFSIVLATYSAVKTTDTVTGPFSRDDVLRARTVL